jgi:predicted acetyltransferase
VTITYSRATTDEVDELIDFDARNFGHPPEPAWIAAMNESIDLDRFVTARDDGRLVGLAANYGLQLTLPGPAPLAMAGVGCVSVAPTHRRQGVATAMMRWLEDDARTHGEPLVGLTASEGGIYERMGYGIATSTRIISIDRRRVAIDPRWDVDTTTVTVARHGAQFDQIESIYNRYWHQRPGELFRPRWLIDFNLCHHPERVESIALHADGYAVWEVTADWNQGDPRHRVNVKDLVAVTEEAYLALWKTLLSIDLVGEVRSMRAAGLDDPLPYFLTDPRAMKTEHIGDHLWLKVLDPVAAFAARRYGTDDIMVLETTGGTRLRVGNSGVQPTDAIPDLFVEDSALGPLLLGGVTASVLASGRRLRARSPIDMGRADLLFGVSPRPHCSTPF